MKRVLLVLVVAGCAAEMEPVSVVVSASGGACLTCANNSPVVESYRFHDLNKFGLPNAQGLTLDGFEKDGKTLTLDVVNGYLSGTDAAGTVLVGDELAGAIISISDEAGTLFFLKIRGVMLGNYWAWSPTTHTQPDLEMYDITWAEASKAARDPGAFQPLCPDAVDDNDSLGMPRYWAVVYEGDRIDGKRYTVDKIDRDWFDIGCAGHTVAKLAQTGHTEAATSVGFDTSLDQRQAILKMFAADYCGIGMPFTVTGQPLYWRDDLGYMTSVPTGPVMFETRWSASGVTCLYRPRVDAHPTPDSIAAFGTSVEDDIKRYCGYRPPLCTDLDPDHFNGAHLITGTPL